MTDNNYIGNGTTIGKFILIPFAGWIIGTAAAKGFDLGVDAQTLAEVIGVLLGLAYSYLDAKYPNTFNFLGNNNDDAPGITTDEQIQPIGEDDEDDVY